MDSIEIAERKLLSATLDYVKRKNIPLESVLSVTLSILVSVLRSCDDRAEAVNQTLDFLKEHIL